MAKFLFNPKLFNPLYWHLKPLLRDPAIRFIYIEGGSSAAKTAEICNATLIDMMEYNYSALVFRRLHVDLKDSVFASYKKAISRLSLEQVYKDQEDLIKGDKDYRLRFRGLDNEENIKGIEDYDIVYNNEWSQFTEDQWSQQRKRLRGRPNQKFICDWNPISSKLWQYEEWIDKDTWIDLPLNIDSPATYNSLDHQYSFKRVNAKGNSIWMKVTYRDNFWIVGHPSGKGGYVDQHTLDDFEYDRVHHPNLYRIYANGERGVRRSGGEFWKKFDEIKHTGTFKPIQSTYHISVDNNVAPYIAIQIWQIDQGNKRLLQTDEIPCKHPNNTASKAALMVCKWLSDKNYNDTVFVYGDPSANARSTTDDDGRSFFQKFISTIRNNFNVHDRVKKSAPRVAASGDFINEIYESNYAGWSIMISDSCKVSIEDYLMTKEAADGTILKKREIDKQTGQSYEKYAHMSDVKRYFITTVLDYEFKQYGRKNSKIFGYSV